MAYPKKVTTIRDAIRKRRLELGLRQKDLAKIIGYDKTGVLNWEKGLAFIRKSRSAMNKPLLRMRGIFPCRSRCAAHYLVRDKSSKL